MERIDIARRVFANDQYAVGLTGIVIESVGNHEAECSLDVDSRHRNARGAAMGGVLFTLSDFTAAVAANSECLDTELQWVSLNATIHYLSPALGNRLLAHCKALKHGRTTALYQSTITDAESGRTVAVAEVTMISV